MRIVYAVSMCVAGLLTMQTVAGAQDVSRRGYLFRPPPATLTVFGSLASPTAGSDLFGFTFDNLTLGKGDLRSFERGVDLAIRLNERWDAVLGVSFNGSRSRSEFRDFVDQDDQPIEQSTVFSRVPLSATARYHLTSRGRAIGTRAWIPARLTPWVGLGGGMMQYRFSQFGDFVDYETFDVFEDRFTARGWAPFAQGALGAGFTLSPHFQLTGEMRYVYGRGDNGDQFVGFERIDLSGMSTAVGLTVRF